MSSAALPSGIVDSHCHLDIMDGSVAQHLQAARDAGVDKVVTIGIDVASSRWCAETAAEHEGVAATVAIHPNESFAATEAAIAQIDALAALPAVRGIGETGLDYYRDTASPGQQQESFRRHIDIAKRHDKTLVIHDREAHDDVLRVLREEGPPRRVVFHCFSGDAVFARTCAANGYYMSFAGNVTFKNAQSLRDAAVACPLELMLVETDAPFLAPVPHRGQPNSPALLPLTVEAIAEARGEDVGEITHTVADNAYKMFFL